MRHNLWRVLPVAPSELFAKMAGFSPLTIQLLYNRGISEPAQFEPFITADERLTGDPFQLPDMHQAVSRIYHALLRGEKIAVYGDFDADGITATALLVQALSALGGTVIPYIPHRLKEGYGLSSTALKGLYQQGTTLIITVDCGITGITEVKYARKMGLDIIITDHHSILTTIPPAIAVVDPKRADSAYSFPDLAGVGVAFKLAQALLHGTGKERLQDKLVDLVALGTVADMTPLLGENRYLVKHGLELINNTERPGLKELMLQAGLEPGNINTENISWALAPRLNAASRLDHALIGYRLLMTSSREEGHLLAQELGEKNAERQRLTDEVQAKAREQVFEIGADSKLLLVGREDYTAGVLGIVASRLVNEFYRPALVLKLGQAMSRGSARSIPEFDLIAALKECHDLLYRYGGHPMAAGFTLPTKNIALFRQHLLEMATSKLATVDLRPHLVIDAEIPLSQLDTETFKLIQQLAPFGSSNPVPTFLSRGVKVIDCRPIGTKGKHLRLKLREGDITWEAVGFQLGNLSSEIAPQLDIVYNLGVDQWGGEEMLQLNILDFAPSRQAT